MSNHQGSVAYFETDLGVGFLHAVAMGVPGVIASEAREGSWLSFLGLGVFAWRLVSFCRWVDALWAVRTGGIPHSKSL